ncbi:hypothetical protein [Moheibacter stercoris]|uniref:Uncharacterized protein n=1 Tax=Moheibacter stercoris TaxID=1628251 RepID=A0ABV2LWJ1_9FLAO
MKQAVSNIDLLVQELIQSDNKERFAQLNSELNDNIFDLLIENSQKEDIFSAILVIKIFTPINEQIEFLKNNLPSGRNGFQQKRKMKEKISFFSSLLNNISELYRKQLISKLDIEIIKRNLQKTNGIIEPLDELEKLIEEISLDEFKDFLHQMYSQTVEYFNSRQLQTQEVEQYRGELLSFIEKLRLKIFSLNSEIFILNVQLKDFEKKYENDNRNDYYVDSIYETSHEIWAYEFHKEILKDLINSLYKTHPFLKTFETSDIPLTVFGNRNYDFFSEFYTELKVFIDPYIVDFNIFKEIFTYNNAPPLKKVNLQNGTLNDFADLLNKLEPYFIPDLRNGNEYNIWWASRFLFNNVEKTPAQVSKFRSNTRRGIDRLPSSPEKIKDILKTFESIPQK